MASDLTLPAELLSWLELGTQQQIAFFAWLVENKQDPRKAKNKKQREANSGEAIWDHPVPSTIR